MHPAKRMQWSFFWILTVSAVLRFVSFAQLTILIQGYSMSRLKITDLDSSYTVCHVYFLFQIIRCLVLILYDEVNYLLHMDGEQLANHDR